MPVEEDLLQRFEARTLPVDEFRHGDHLRLTWYLLTQHPLPDAAKRLITGLQKFAALHGLHQLYHETITLFYLYEVSRRMGLLPESHRWTDFQAANPEMFVPHREFIGRYYSGEALDSDFARRHFLPPAAALGQQLLRQ
jgi:hypothetical protein